MQVFKQVKRNIQSDCQPASPKSALKNRMEKMMHRSINWELKKRNIEVRSSQWGLWRTTLVKGVRFHNSTELHTCIPTG